MSKNLKFQNPKKELNLKKIRLNKYHSEYKNYSDQQERVNKLLLKLKFKDNEGNLLWKNNLKNENDEYEYAFFKYPKEKFIN